MSSSETRINEYPTPDILPGQEDLFFCTRDPNGIPGSVNYTYGQLFANVSVTVSFANTVTANTLNVAQLTLTNKYTPNSSHSPTKRGRVTWDDNYVYISTDDATIRRIPLQIF